eukprot:scaffold135304_cov50-Attheya_sp.AAC.4
MPHFLQCADMSIRYVFLRVMTDHLIFFSLVVATLGSSMRFKQGFKQGFKPSEIIWKSHIFCSLEAAHYDIQK